MTIGGKSRHVIGYLEEFLFSPERSRTPVRFLSGGECNRVLLARLFAKPANVIVLDEPTNDLDAETLELLEERLVQFQGTVLVVSHDRAFPEQRRHQHDRVRRWRGARVRWRLRRLAAAAGATIGVGRRAEPASCRGHGRDSRTIFERGKIAGASGDFPTRNNKS